MPCPFFIPDRRLEAGPWTNPPRLPLGDAYFGTCRARSGEIYSPEESHQREFCNCGYARGRCDRFPAGEAADAVRFSVTTAADASGSACRLRLVYIVEKGHAPASHGAIEFSAAEDVLNHWPEGEFLSAQAWAFAASYLRKTQSPEPAV